MHEKAKISARQTTWLLLNTILTTTILFLPGLIAREARQDAWLSVVIVTIFGLFTAWVITSLSQRFPGETVIEFSRVILGNILGSAIGWIMIPFFIYINSIIIREFSELIVTLFLPETPLSAVVVAIVMTAAYVNRSGLETLARVNEIILPIVLAMIVFILLLSVRDMDVKKLLPILGHGWLPVFKGAYVAALFFAETVVMLVLTPNLTDHTVVKKATLKAVLWVGLFELLVMVGIIAELGLETPTLKFPFMSLSRYILVFDAIERLEPLTLIIWVMGGFVKISVFLYCSLVTTAQTLKLPDYRPLVVPFAALLIILALVLWPSGTDLSHLISTVLPAVFLPLELGLPLFLLLIVRIKELGGKEK